MGIEYVESRFHAAGSVLPQWHIIEGTDLKVLVPGNQNRGASDYTDRRPDWALVHEEAFNPEGARQKWIANIDWAKENGCLRWPRPSRIGTQIRTGRAQGKRHGRMAGLVIHPWMLMINPGEVKVVKDVIHYARDQGAWMATVNGLIELALAQQNTLISD